MATMLILVASIWCDAGFNFHRFGCGVGSGQIAAWWWDYCDYGFDEETFGTFEVHSAQFALSLPLLDSETHIYALGETTAPTGRQWFVVLPLWLLFLVLTLATGFLWWRDRRRARAGFCRKCGYDLTGNVSGTCPECGTEIKPLVG